MSLCAIVLGPAVLFYSIQDARSFYSLKRRIVSYSLLPDRLAPTVARVQVGTGIAFGVLSIVGLMGPAIMVDVLFVASVALVSAAWHCARWLQVRTVQAVTAIRNTILSGPELRPLHRKLA